MMNNIDEEGAKYIIEIERTVDIPEVDYKEKTPSWTEDEDEENIENSNKEEINQIENNNHQLINFQNNNKKEEIIPNFFNLNNNNKSNYLFNSYSKLFTNNDYFQKMPKIFYEHLLQLNQRLNRDLLEKLTYVDNDFILNDILHLFTHFIEEEYGMRTWKMILYQKKMATNASCVVVSDKEEEAYLINSKIARRVQYIPDPRDGDYVDLDSYTSSILRIYQKIIDTDMGVHLDKNSREAVCALLHLSLAGENERKPLCPEDILNLRAIAPRQWNNIMIFAMEQGISQYVSQGILKAQLNLPAIDVQQIEQFPALHPKDKNKLESGQLLSDNWLLKRKARKLENVEPVAKKICIMLFNLQYHSQRLTLSLRHLCDLYEVYRFENVDEDFLKNLLEELGLLTFARRINQVLSETIYLEHGFMPVPALDDRGTSIIRNNLIKY